MTTFKKSTATWQQDKSCLIMQAQAADSCIKCLHMQQAFLATMLMKNSADPFYRRTCKIKFAFLSYHAKANDRPDPLSNKQSTLIVRCYFYTVFKSTFIIALIHGALMCNNTFIHWVLVFMGETHATYVSVPVPSCLLLLVLLLLPFLIICPFMAFYNSAPLLCVFKQICSSQESSRLWTFCQERKRNSNQPGQKKEALNVGKEPF